jgi:GGDEF domain-containing protein
MSERDDDLVADLRRQLSEAREALRRRTEEAGLLRLQLDALSTTELTTGLLNLAGLAEAIETAFHRLGRLGEPFAVIGIRIPALARFAGAGHGVMREALRHLGAIIAAGLRALDRTGRLDATTFVAVVPLKTPNAYAAVLDRLRTVLTAGPVSVGDESFDPDPHFCVVLGEAPTAATAGDPASVVQLVEDLLAAASEAATAVARL